MIHRFCDICKNPIFLFIQVRFRVDNRFSLVARPLLPPLARSVGTISGRSTYSSSPQGNYTNVTFPLIRSRGWHSQEFGKRFFKIVYLRQAGDRQGYSRQNIENRLSCSPRKHLPTLLPPRCNCIQPTSCT